MPGIAGKSCSAQVGVTVILPWASGRITNYLFKLTTKASIFVANMPSNPIIVEQVAKVASNEHGSRMTSSRGMRQSIIIDFCVNSIHRPYQLFSRCTQRLGHYATPWDDVRCYFFPVQFFHSTCLSANVSLTRSPDSSAPPVLHRKPTPQTSSSYVYLFVILCISFIDSYYIVKSCTMPPVFPLVVEPITIPRLDHRF